uniref:Uncharacterized protein n=1 Tax=Arundo donax TaxID=35708 RepID=A0A0A9GET8_ARUDO
MDRSSNVIFFFLFHIAKLSCRRTLKTVHSLLKEEGGGGRSAKIFCLTCNHLSSSLRPLFSFVAQKQHIQHQH